MNITEKEIEQIRTYIEKQDSGKIKEILANMHPADIAELCDELEVEEARFIYRQLDNETAADILMEMDEDTRKELLDQLPSETIARKFVDNMETDDAADLMRELDKEKKEEVLQHIEDIEQASDIVDLLKYEEGTAGSLMKTEMVTINQNWSMPESLKQMRIQAEDADEIHYVYVVDDEERLVGVFQLKTMITNPNVSKIKHVMKRDPISVKVDTPIEDVAQTIEKYDLVALPVIDSIGRLVGQITVDDVMDEIREQSERDYQLASGLSQDVDMDDNILRQTTARLPWLLLGIFGGITNSVILGKFNLIIQRFPEMIVYIPLIGGTGGNVGTQSSAIVVQGLANNSLDKNNIAKQIGKESIVSLINATLISLLMYIYNFLRYGPTNTVSYSVSLSLFCVVMFASFFGTLVPMTLERLKIDPAIATGPFISIANDIIGVMIYLSITMLLS
ncbi:MAG: magnesium transporter [Bacteroidaceae bacterium]|jgi:magnesium transporter